MAGATCGDLGASLFVEPQHLVMLECHCLVEGGTFGHVGMSLYMAGETFGDVGVSLLRAM